MALPTVVNVANGAGYANGNTMAMPASLAAGDIVLQHLVTSHRDASPPAGWANVLNSPKLGPTNSGSEPWYDPGEDHAIREYIWWHRMASGADAGPLLTLVGLAWGAAIAIRGCVESGNPWDVGSISAGSGWGALSIPGATTTGADRLVVLFAGQSTTYTHSAWANADLGSLTEYVDNSYAPAGIGGAIVTGTKAAAGAYGTTTLTVSGADGTNVGLSLALKPPLVAVGRSFPMVGMVG